jgi:hypothetical protein
MANLYPFLSKSDIKTRIVNDVSFAMECAQIMTSRQTEYEQEAKTTVNKNRRGWSCSHAVFGTTATNKLRAGEELEPHEVARLQDMTSHYSKQLASHFRVEAIKANPDLKAIAERAWSTRVVFSAG